MTRTVPSTDTKLLHKETGEHMAKITLKGNPVHTTGELPAVGTTAPDFTLTGPDLTDMSLADFGSKRKILNVVPSLDTGICAASAVRFNKDVTTRENTVVVNVSCDLPFAAKRFCDANGIENIHTLTAMRDRSFGERYGLTMTDGPFAGIFARAVIVLDEANRVTYTELVPEIAQEPDYDAALNAIN